MNMKAHEIGKGSVGEVAKLFLKLGTIAFGGPAAHIAMMQDEACRRRGWLSEERFLDLLGAANLIPGPSSTEMATKGLDGKDSSPAGFVSSCRPC